MWKSRSKGPNKVLEIPRLRLYYVLMCILAAADVRGPGQRLEHAEQRTEAGKTSGTATCSGLDARIVGTIRRAASVDRKSGEASFAHASRASILASTSCQKAEMQS